MTREEVKTLLGEGATEEQVSAVLNKFHTEQQGFNTTIADLQGQVTDLNTEKNELLGYKTKVEEIERANLSKEEQLQLREQELIKQQAATKMLQNSIKAKSVLVGAGMSEEEADAMVATIVKEDEDATLKAANLFANKFNTLREDVAKKTKEDLMTLDAKPGASNIPPNQEPGSMTWEKFSKLSDKEQEEFRKENPEEFLKL